MDTGWAVVLGASIAFVASLLSGVLLPWWREALDRGRSRRERERTELRRVLLELETALLNYRQTKRFGGVEASAGIVRYAAAQNELALVLPTKDTVVIDIALMMFGAVQDDVAGIEDIVGESLSVLNAWYRGELKTDDLIGTIEARAKIKFSEDHRSVRRA